MLEPDDGKLSSPVLRGEGGSDAPDLPGNLQQLTVWSLSVNCWGRQIGRLGYQQLGFIINKPPDLAKVAQIYMVFR